MKYADRKIKIILVDDDAVFLHLLKIELANLPNFEVKTWPTGELCLANLALEKPDFIVLDFHLDGIEKDAMNGLETLDKIKALEPKMPIVMLSSQDKIEVAISCMHHGALDYVVKSETSYLRLQKIVEAFFKLEKMEHQLSWYMSRM